MDLGEADLVGVAVEDDHPVLERDVADDADVGRHDAPVVAVLVLERVLGGLEREVVALDHHCRLQLVRFTVVEDKLRQPLLHEFKGCKSN